VDVQAPSVASEIRIHELAAFVICESPIAPTGSRGREWRDADFQRGYGFGNGLVFPASRAGSKNTPMNGPSEFSTARLTGPLSFDTPGVAAEGRAVNTWLVLLCLLGFIIVLGDGSSRLLRLDEDEVTAAPTEYEPFYGAFVFAFCTLPLALGYAKRDGIPRKEGFFLWFVMCTVAYSKDFSYISVPGVKIFITDITLAALAVSLYPSLRKGFRCLGKVPTLAIGGFFFAGALATTRGLVSGQDKLLVLRDSAIFVYSLFLPLGFLLVSSWDAAKRVFTFFAIGATFCSLNALSWFVMQPGQRRYLGYGIYLVVALFGVFLAKANGAMRRGSLTLAVLCSTRALPISLWQVASPSSCSRERICRDIMVSYPA
jgi:hypothetical protein